MDEVEGRGHLIVASRVEGTARVPGLEAAALDEFAARADAGCPLSTLIRATAEVEVSSRLES
jgi:organic hydroperoxide reductase OsmC/OhrA